MIGCYYTYYSSSYNFLSAFWKTLRSDSALISYIPFPSHYGSRSTLGRRVAALSGSVFPSHYGSRSEEPSFVVRPRSWTRPSYIFSFRRYESGFLVLGPRQRKERRCRIRVRHDGKRLSSHTPYRHPVMLLYGISLLPGTNNEQPTTALIIPLWFSLNNYGPWVDWEDEMCFHPTMVLAQQNGYMLIEDDASVSIPLWFSLNRFVRTVRS